MVEASQPLEAELVLALRRHLVSEVRLHSVANHPLKVDYSPRDLGPTRRLRAQLPQAVPQRDLQRKNKLNSRWRSNAPFNVTIFRFANRSSAFGQLAQTPQQQQPSAFGGGGASMNQTGGGFSS